jgi:membrane associated rhomboid family serine protease
MAVSPEIRRALYLPLALLVIIWAVWLITWADGNSSGHWGILPRRWNHWYGIFTGPLIHASWQHLLSNTFPLLLLGWLLFISYPKRACLVFTGIYLFTGILVWLFARESFHIGASGIVYGLAGYLFFGGIFRSDTGSIAVALIVAFLYGSLVWGVLPHQPGISWESHLFGGITGAILAALFARTEKTDEADDDIPSKRFRAYIAEINKQENE